MLDRSAAVAVFVGLLLLPPAVTPAAESSARAPKPPVVSYRDDKVSVAASDAPVQAVIDALANAATLEVHGKVPEGRRVTAEFTDVPTQEAVERILGNQNFTLRYVDRDLVAIDLKSDAEEKRPVEAETPLEKSPSDYAPAGWWKMTNAFMGKRIPVTGELAKMHGADTASWDQIVQGAYAFDSAGNRAEAVKAGLKAFEADKELRDTVVKATENMDDRELARFVRAFCRDTGEKFLRMVARYTNDPVIRQRFSSVAREVRALDQAGEPLPFGKMPPKGQRH